MAPKKLPASLTGSDEDGDKDKSSKNIKGGEGAVMMTAAEKAERDERLSCRFYEDEYPEKDTCVMVQVESIAKKMGAYVSLLEYKDIEGMILLSELSGGASDRSISLFAWESSRWLWSCASTRKRGTSISPSAGSLRKRYRQVRG